MWCSSHRVCGKNCTIDDDKNHHAAVSMLACWNHTIGTKAKTRHFSFRELHVCRSSAYRVIIVKAIIAWRGRDWFHTRIHKRHKFSRCLLLLKRCTRQMGGYVVEVTSHKHAWPINVASRVCVWIPKGQFVHCLVTNLYKAALMLRQQNMMHLPKALAFE